MSRKMDDKDCAHDFSFKKTYEEHVEKRETICMVE